MFTNARASLNVMEPSDMPGLGSETVLSRELPGLYMKYALTL
jgi:hypothetical protein